MNYLKTFVSIQKLSTKSLGAGSSTWFYSTATATATTATTKKSQAKPKLTVEEAKVKAQAKEEKKQLKADKQLERAVAKVERANKPKSFVNAWSIYVKTNFANSHGVVTKEKMKPLSESFKLLDQSSKNKYVDAAAQHNKKIAEENQTKLVKPKKPLTPYIQFFITQKSQFKQGTDRTNFADITKNVATQWNALTPEQKQPYEQLSQKDNTRYENELSHYQSKFNAAVQQLLNATNNKTQKPKKN
ncbi:hypothetical protein DFA_09960 [Cavenderia fasciculata]|uniref:HMG box domain-containing protein n=1 Tax=Cavenderia fasciculata TaxID=261658 RepID=F4Q8W7_CACFS|nr:uncharacterized protein DFA_09960 [Cavenderia fasciculata]EGG15136.1 hypothetical protein DFA_09960 [Cavenderia fasciculata]|eukprot:XP_004351856.1 hypothetical protein DFA_09960 [Cavenderia fasciculata]